MTYFKIWKLKANSYNIMMQEYFYVFYVFIVLVMVEFTLPPGKKLQTLLCMKMTAKDAYTANTCIPPALHTPLDDAYLIGFFVCLFCFVLFVCFSPIITGFTFLNIIWIEIEATHMVITSMKRISKLGQESVWFLTLTFIN